MLCGTLVADGFVPGRAVMVMHAFPWILFTIVGLAWMA